MYTFPYDKPAPGAHLRLTPDMIERRLNVQPFDITIDIPIMFDRLPEDAKQRILEALAADAYLNGCILLETHSKNRGNS